MTNAEYVQKQGVRFADLKWRASGREEFDILAGARGAIGHVRMDGQTYADPRLVWLDRERWAAAAHGGDERNDEGAGGSGTMTNAEYVASKGWKFRGLYAQFSEKEHKWGIYQEGAAEKIDSIAAPDFKDFFHGRDVVAAWLDMEYKRPILDEAEKRYLRTVIRPWKGYMRVTSVEKRGNGKGAEWLIICYDSAYGYQTRLPIFADGTMYKGMERNRKYTPEELGI